MDDTETRAHNTTAEDEPITSAAAVDNAENVSQIEIVATNDGNSSDIEIVAQSSTTENDTNPNDALQLRPARGAEPAYHEYKGGHKAHIFRRVYHVCIFTVIPILFFWFFKPVANAMDISVAKLLSVLILLQIIAEGLRIKFKFIIFGMREYERTQVCAQAWGTIATFVVFLLAYPRAYSIAPVFSETHRGTDETKSEIYACYAQIGLPLIWSLGFGDPLIGELKHMSFIKNSNHPIAYRCLIAWLVLVFVYIIAFLWCGTPWWLMLLMPPIAIAAEYPSFKVIDDNAMMLLVPLLFTLLFEPWFGKKCDQIFYN